MDKHNELPNGIKVIPGKQDHDRKDAHIFVGVRTGSSYESKVTQGVVALIIAVYKLFAKQSGLQMFVYKGGDVTIFEVIVPAESLEDALRVIAKIMIDTRFPGAILRGAVADVLQEVRDNEPLLDKQMSLAAKKAAQSEVVWSAEKYCASVVKNADIKTLSAFCKRYVVGSNLVIAVEGNYGDSAKLMETIEAEFVEMPKGEPAEKLHHQYVGGFVKIPHIGINRVKVAFPLKGVTDFASAHVLIEVLQSWLIRRFNDLDPEASFDLRVAHNMGNRLIEMTVVSKKSINDIMSVFDYEINRLINEGPSERRLERSKQRAMTNRLGKREAPEAMLDDMVMILRQGKVINYGKSVWSMAGVLPSDIKDCAKTIFVDYPPTVVIATQEADNEHMTYEQMTAMIKVDD